jgi:hypothetical protein
MPFMADQLSQNDAIELSFDRLIGGFPHIPPERGAMMAQAAVVCLNHQGHSPGVGLVVDGDFSAAFTLSWSGDVTEAMRRFWNDLEEATQQGAYAVAILLLHTLTGYTVIERSRKGTGFDWWLGNETIYSRERRAWRSRASCGAPRGASTAGFRPGSGRPGNRTNWI